MNIAMVICLGIENLLQRVVIHMALGACFHLGVYLGSQFSPHGPFSTGLLVLSNNMVNRFQE